MHGKGREVHNETMHKESSDVIFSAATQRNGGETEVEEEKWRGEEGPICLKCTADARTVAMSANQTKTPIAPRQWGRRS